jgi:hypothetical protein
VTRFIRSVWLLAAVVIACAGPVALDTGLTGTVQRGPVMPVCQTNVPCDGPFAATFEVRRGGKRVAGFSSDAQGRFSVSIPPGTYLIVPADDAPIMNPSAQAKTVEVGPEGLTSVQLSFDTGIR